LRNWTRDGGIVYLIRIKAIGRNRVYEKTMYADRRMVEEQRYRIKRGARRP